MPRADVVGVGGQPSVCPVLNGVVDALGFALAARAWCECHYLRGSCVVSSSVGADVAAVIVFVVVAGVVVDVIVVCRSGGHVVVPVGSSEMVVSASALSPLGRCGGLAQAASGDLVHEVAEWLVEDVVVRDVGCVDPAAFSGGR